MGLHRRKENLDDRSQRTAAILNLIEEEIVVVMATANAEGSSSIEVIYALEMIVKNACVV